MFRELEVIVVPGSFDFFGPPAEEDLFGKVE